MEDPLPFSKKARYAAETVAAYIIYGVFRLLPLETASAFGGKILRRFGPGMGVTRVAERNLSLAFPEKTEEEKKKIIAGMWENLGRVIGEYPHLHSIWRNVEVTGLENAQSILKSGKPVIFISGHLANWEINPICARQVGLPVHVVYRKPNNAGVDGLLRHARAAGAAGYIEKGREGARQILSILKKGGAVGMLVDQKLNEGVAVPFFGHDAMTAPAPAHFALRFGLPLLPTHVERVGGAKFRMIIQPPLPTASTGDLEADTRRILASMNQLIEDWVRARPEQWLWIHKRWPQSG